MAGIGWQPQRPDLRTPASQAELDAAVALLRGRQLVALTGAGFSTDSGLPDYRGPDALPRRPTTFDEFVSDAALRRRYWARNHLGWHAMERAEPNAGHLALADLEDRGPLGGVITQNVDRLHQRAGSRQVVDLHGRYDRVRCLGCSWVCSRADLDEMLEAVNPGFAAGFAEVGAVEIAPDADADITGTEGFVVVDCPVCAGMLKPDLVFFGESVPKPVKHQAQELVDRSEAVLVAGTSLAVISGLRLVRRAARDGKPVVVVNQGLTRADDLATLRLKAGTSEVVGYLLHHLV